jgi:hypothetical protein
VSNRNQNQSNAIFWKFLSFLFQISVLVLKSSFYPHFNLPHDEALLDFGSLQGRSQSPRTESRIRPGNLSHFAILLSLVKRKLRNTFFQFILWVED